MNKRLVITGMGAVTPIGIGTDTYWENLLAGKTGIDYIQSLDIEDLPVKIAGEVRDLIRRIICQERNRMKWIVSCR